MEPTCISGNRYWNPDRLLFLLFTIVSLMTLTYFWVNIGTYGHSFVLFSIVAVGVSAILVYMSDDRHGLEAKFFADRLEIARWNGRFTIPWKDVTLIKRVVYQKGFMKEWACKYQIFTKNPDEPWVTLYTDALSDYDVNEMLYLFYRYVKPFGYKIELD